MSEVKVKKQITPEGKYWQGRIRSKDLEINSLQGKLKELKEELDGWVSLTTQSSTDYIPHVIREHVTNLTCAERDQLRVELEASKLRIELLRNGLERIMKNTPLQQQWDCVIARETLEAAGEVDDECGGFN